MEQNTIKKKLYVAGLVGEIMEWFDFTVYGFFALIIAQNFFPAEDHFVSLIAAFSAFAIGFLMRPIGAFIFGYLGDRYGRKKVLTTSMLLMAFPSLIITLTPTYETIGIFAPILLVLMRMLQGISVGGEHTGSIIYLAELSDYNKRAFAAAVPFIGTILGVLMGSLVGVGIFILFSHESIVNWAWRIPFAMGVLIAFVGIMIRKHLPESNTNNEDKYTLMPIAEIFQKHLSPFIKVFLMNLPFAVGFYTVFIYNPIWMQQFLHDSEQYTLEINSIALILAVLVMPVSALLSNKVGRKPLLLFATGGLTLFSWPLYRLMLSDVPLHTLAGQGIFAIFIGIFMGTVGVVMVELFSRNIRVSAVSIAYNISFAIFGGTAPIIATWLIHSTHDNLSLAWYLSASALISFLTILTIDETYKKNPLD
jgi:MHS family proline/betaine transporter-like MFS transporter